MLWQPAACLLCQLDQQVLSRVCCSQWCRQNFIMDRQENLAESTAFSSQGAEFLNCSDWQCASTSQRIWKSGAWVSYDVRIFRPYETSLSGLSIELAGHRFCGAVCLEWNTPFCKIAYRHRFGRWLKYDEVQQEETGAQDRPESLQAGSKLQTRAVLNCSDLLKDSTLNPESSSNKAGVQQVRDSLSTTEKDANTACFPGLSRDFVFKNLTILVALHVKSI